ncbi:MAG: hypothetical protein KF850_39820 [Labilithrix sp.]|nr:hypothetical protein [Labilithrix sp.]MBX3218222.1 hypothetical protein [Labilithrix sp.]
MRPRSSLGRVAALAPAIVAALAGCAHHESLAVGEALTIGDGRLAPAIAAEIAEGTGTSGDGATSFVEARGRVLVGATRQQLGGLAGVSRLGWLGPRAPLWIAANVGPGVERFSGTVFLDAIAQARLGTGFVLAEASEPYRPLNPWGVEAEPFPREPHPWGAPRPSAVLRTRVLLTLAVVGDVDARFTRAPLYVASLMIGISRVEEIRRWP